METTRHLPKLGVTTVTSEVPRSDHRTEWQVRCVVGMGGGGTLGKVEGY